MFQNRRDKRKIQAGKRDLAKNSLTKTRTVAVFLAVLSICVAATGKSRVELLPAIMVTQEYDDNIYLGQTNKTSDYLTTVSPQIGISAASERDSLQFTYAPTFTYYSNRSEENRVRHRSTLAYRHSFSR